MFKPTARRSACPAAVLVVDATLADSQDISLVTVQPVLVQIKDFEEDTSHVADTVCEAAMLPPLDLLPVTSAAVQTIMLEIARLKL